MAERETALLSSGYARQRTRRHRFTLLLLALFNVVVLHCPPSSATIRRKC